MLVVWPKRLTSIRTQTAVRGLLALLCLALIATRMGGDHLHLCLDGLGDEPASSVHPVDSGLHHVDGVGSSHNDIDVSLARVGPGYKASILAGDLPPLIFASLVLLLSSAPRREGIPRAPASFVTPLPTFRILPPLRAPPR